MPPRSFTEEEDSLPLTDLLRTGEASRLRRRGAMRGGHRREDSDELPTSLHRRVRVESAGQRLTDETQDGVYLELSCGVRTGQCSFTPPSPSGSSPLPRTQSSRLSSDVGFVFASTGCGTQVSSRASPKQPDCSVAHQVYTSTDLTTTGISRLPSKYLDSEQRSIAEFLSKEDCGCRCEWEAIGCRVCGNALGFLYAPCHTRHSLDNSRVSDNPTYVFFPSSVTPSPSYIFPTIDPTLYRSLPPAVALSESDDMSIDYSPTFSPRVQVTSANNFYAHSPRAESQLPRPLAQEDPDTVAFSWFSDPNPGLAPSIPASPTAPTPLVFSAVTERPTDYSRADSELEPSSFVPPRPSVEDTRPVPPADVQTRGQATFGPIARLAPGMRHQEAIAASTRTNREVLSDDDWSIYLLGGDRAPSSARRHVNARASSVSRDPLHPWVPREQRERPPGALTSGERVLDRLAAIMRPETSEGSATHSNTSSAALTRTPEPPALHRVPRRALSTLNPPIRRPASFDASSWRQFTGGPPRPSGIVLPSRPAHVPERQEQPHDRERASRVSRWATTPSSSVRSSRRTTVPAPDPSATPAFTLLDSAGEPSYPPSTRSSLDSRDNLSVDSEANVFRMFSRYLNEDALVEAVGLDPELNGTGPSWTDVVGTEEPEAESDDEEKPEDERRTVEPSEGRAPNETDDQQEDSNTPRESPLSQLLSG